MRDDRLPMRPRLAATLAVIPVIVGIWALPHFGAPRSVLDLLFGALATPRSAPPRWLEISISIAFALGPGIYVYFVIVAIWWRSVAWTRVRYWLVGFTSSAIVFAHAFPILHQLLFPLSMFELPFWLIVNGLILVPLALFLVACFCYPKAVEREPSRIACPGCGYDLRGQRSLRCPECGREFALDELA